MKGDISTYHPLLVTDNGESPHISRITDSDFVCNHLYFTNRSFSSDDQKIFFESEKDGGNNLFCLDLAKGEVKQLTEGKNLDYFPYPSVDDKVVFFGDGPFIRSVNIETAEEKMLLDACELTGRIVTKCSGTFPSRDGKKLVCFYESASEYGLIVINLQTGQAKVILRGEQPVRHCQFCPMDSDLILYAHEGDWSKIRARMWLINADGSNNRRVRSHDDGEAEQAGHEFWGNTSRMLYFTIRRAGKVYFSTSNVDTGEETTLFTLDNEHGAISLDDRYIVADNRYGDGQMHIIMLETNQIKTLCYPKMSWLKNMSRFHPHPTFSSKGDKVIYTTDGYGKPGVFVADMPDF